MKITKEQVKYVADLARLNVSDDEAENMAAQMGGIIEAMDTLCEVDTENIEPTNHAIKVENVFRCDEEGEPYSRDELLACAPSKQAGCYSVPKVVE